MSDSVREYSVADLFHVRAGEYHATKDLDPGPVPLISCGDTSNGIVGYYDVPARKTHTHCITVAFNGSWPPRLRRRI